MISLILFVDRYVLLGNHRDAWTFGSIDPSSGTAALMELVEVFTRIRRETGKIYHIKKRKNNEIFIKIKANMG